MTDLATFHVLFVAHAAAVRRVALALSGANDIADDLTAETFARALASRTPIRGESARAWLFAIVRHLWINQHQRTKTPNNDDDVIDELESPDPGPELRALQQQQLAEVQRAIRLLRDGERALLQLALVDGLDHVELAEVLGISRDHIRVRLHRARQRLLNHLQPESA